MAQPADVLIELRQALDSQILELSYEKASRQVDIVTEAEKIRQLQVQILLLEDDNDELRSQLAQDDEHIDDMEEDNRALQESLQICQSNFKSVQGELRMKNREVETLKAELDSLHGVTMDSTKLLTEKLSLAREVSALRPELDYLRAQASSNQSLLAEKLSLQRQLNTIQVELETEKRATQRALAKDGKAQVEDTKFESRIEKLQDELSKERRERQKQEREAQIATKEAENRITTLESRLDACKNKFRSTKDQLKDSQAALQQFQASATMISGRASSTNPAASVPLNSRKRPAVQMDADTMIGTPGDLPVAKRNKHASALPGEKSTFSITPFLNRTASVAPESEISAKANPRDQDGVLPSDTPTHNDKRKAYVRALSEPVNGLEKTRPASQGRKPMALADTNTGKANSRLPPGRKPKAAPRLELVAEEEDDETGSRSRTMVIERASDQGANDDTLNEGVQMKKKKRKLLGGGLGKTLFDEDDADGLRGDKSVLGGVKGLGTFLRGDFGSTELGSRKALGASMSTFGTISPLKKDRRAG
ncbi:hypothetical protein MMC21_001193 [Puttea exsequens]|nr:hypothetical protein [Puttea exsequens]